MGVLKDLQLLDKLVADGKLTPIYLENDLQDLIYVIPTKTLTGELFKYSTGASGLSKEQLEALLSDIDTLKFHNLWDEKTEHQTLKQCKKSMEDAEAYKMLSVSDKAKYDAEFYKVFEL